MKNALQRSSDRLDDSAAPSASPSAAAQDDGRATAPNRQRSDADVSPYIDFTRAEWARLRPAVPVPLAEADLLELRGLNEDLSLQEVDQIYWPLARLLNLHVAAAQALHRVTDTFLGKPSGKIPYVIGIAGSVAVGKSTTARIMQALLSRWPDHPRVDLITTDGFLFPNRVLEERGILDRKGFPESYDVRRLLRFMADVKSGGSPITAPVYSHLRYDIVDGEAQVVDQPDIVIIEGLNVLQTGAAASVFISDFFDFSIYVDAPIDLLRQWYVGRFLRLRETVFTDPQSYFHRFSQLSDDAAMKVAIDIWREINEANLRENIEPTRDRATLVLEKGDEHSVRRVRLRRL